MARLAPIASSRARVESQPADAATRTCPLPACVKTTAASASHASRRAVAPSRARSAGHHGGVDDAADERVLAVHLHADVAAGRRRGTLRQRQTRFSEIGRRLQAPRKSRWRRSDSASPCDRAPADAGKASELQITQTRLMALAQQLEHADALAEVVVRLGQMARRPVQPPAQPEKLSPRSAHGRRADAA